MTTKRGPGQNYQGLIGYRARLGWRDRVRVALGAPLTIGVRLITAIPVPSLRTVSTLLVAGRPCPHSRLEILDTPPGGNDAPTAS